MYNKYNPWGCCRAIPQPRSKRVRNDRKPRENGPPKPLRQPRFLGARSSDFDALPDLGRAEYLHPDPAGIYSSVSQSIFIGPQRRKRRTRFLATVFWSPRVCAPFSRPIIDGATIATIETTAGTCNYRMLHSIRADEHLRRHNLHLKLLLIER